MATDPGTAKSLPSDQGGTAIARWVSTVAAALAFTATPFACSSAAQLAGAGEACAVVTDCQEGLVCCNGPKGSLTCASGVLCIQPPGSGGPAGDGSAQSQGDAASEAVAAADDASPETDARSVPEAEPPDRRSPPPADAGFDAGVLVDASPPNDAATHADVSVPPAEAAAPDAAAD